MMRVLLLILMVVFSIPAQATEPFDFTKFSSLPVQHEGRIKPLDTFARSYLKSFSGSEHIGELNSDEWLAETLFNPAQALQRPLFRVLKPESIGLKPSDNKRYSFAELADFLQSKRAVITQLLDSDSKNWSDDQKELMRLQEQSILYVQLLRSFSLILPLDIAVPQTLAKEWKIDPTQPLTLQKLNQFDTKLQSKMANIVRRKGDNPDRYSAQEREIAAFAYDIQTIRDGGAINVLLRIFPSNWNGADGEWYAPWALTQTGKGSPKSAALMSLWQDAAHAFATGDSEAFTATTRAMKEKYDAYSNPAKLKTEKAYNEYHPLGLSMIGYLLGFFAYAGSVIFARKSLYKSAVVLLGGSFILHSTAIAARVYILDRPPVGTLYESILFVAAICVLIALIIEWRRKDGLGLLTGALSGLLLLFISQAFSADDTMKMLVAVLNTNFWLATHVLCITTGYGICLIASCLAHAHLIRNAFGNERSNLLPAIKTMGLIALLFTAVGTILGGIWADQSWGRFWGWDPKENGALLIVLWLIWIYHSHLSGHLNQLVMSAAMAALSIVVALAWFGVNLLNVGLHSYGFITGVALSLAAFCGAELAIIGFLWYRAWQRKISA